MEKNDKDDINVESPWYYFYSQGCAYCKQLEPIIEELNQEGNEILKLDMVEPDNKQLYLELKKEYKKECGTPWLINAETGNHICGFREKNVIQKWLDGEVIPEPPRQVGQLPRPPFQGASKKEVKKWKVLYNKWSEKNTHMPNLLTSEEILAKPRPKSQPPQFPPINAEEEDYSKFKDDWDKWAKDNKHLPNLQSGLDVVSRLKNRINQQPQQPGNNPGLEARLSRLEDKMNRIITHLGVR